MRFVGFSLMPLLQRPQVYVGVFLTQARDRRAILSAFRTQVRCPIFKHQK
jgi:hypothetical protein